MSPAKIEKIIEVAKANSAKRTNLKPEKDEELIRQDKKQEQINALGEKK